VKSGIVKGW